MVQFGWWFLEQYPRLLLAFFCCTVLLNGTFILPLIFFKKGFLSRMHFLLHPGLLNSCFSEAVRKGKSKKGSISKWLRAALTSGFLVGSEEVQVRVHLTDHFTEGVFMLRPEVITDPRCPRRATRTETPGCVLIIALELCMASRSCHTPHPRWLELLSAERWIGLRVVAEVIGSWTCRREY